ACSFRRKACPGIFGDHEMRTRHLLWAIALSAAVAVPAIAQDPVKIGLITTLSGPGGYIGADIRDGFLLAVEMEGGKLGGVPVQVIVEDDGFKPGQGKQIADKFLKTSSCSPGSCSPTSPARQCRIFST